MNRIIQMVVFFSIFLLLFLALNSYVILKLTSMLNIENKIFSYILIAFLTIGFPSMTALERSYPNFITRLLYMVSSFWIGMVLLLTTSLLIYKLINKFTELDQRAAAITIIVVVLFISVLAIFNATRVSTKEFNLQIPNLKEDLKVVQLSDIHLGSIRNSDFLDKLMTQIKVIDPDIVLITGDLVDGTAPLHQGILDPFNDLRADTYYVLGNHETYEGLDKVKSVLNTTKIILLEDKMINTHNIQLIGISFDEGSAHIKEQLNKLTIDKETPSILMYHAPVQSNFVSEKGINLQLAGHTHNGQIFPFNLLLKPFFPRTNGLYLINQTFLYVSPGTGTWGPYMRFGSKNEITVFNLKGNVI